jgi:2-dehydro-3-deoxygluconokinase
VSAQQKLGDVTAHHPSSVLTVGEPIVAIMPDAPTPVDASTSMRTSVGGAELNTAVALRRLGLDVTFIGRVGDDIFGRLVLDHLRAEDISTDTVVVDPTRPTACYVREWLPDGRRRISYHRSGAAGAALGLSDVVWPERAPDIVHVTGITMALSPNARAVIERVVDHAGAHGIAISFDPNHRPALWSADDARATLLAVADRATVTLLSEDDREVMYPGLDERAVLAAAAERAGSTVVMKLGDRGVIAADGGTMIEVPADLVARPLDPVGAGDAFDAGFLAAHLAGASLRDALAVGAHVAARVVEVAGDHDGAPRLDQLPEHLAELVRGNRR